MKRNLYKYLGLCLLASSAGMSANAQSTVAKFTKVATPVPAQKASGSLAAGDFYHSTYCGATWGDYNNDGFLDGYMSGWCNGGCSKGCGVELWQNTSAASGIAPNEAPSMPSGLNATFDAKTGLATFTWSAASDDFTPAQGLRYNFFIKKEGSDETFMVLPADVTTGFVKVGNTTGAIITTQYKFKVPTSGTYEWGVQAIDGGNKGSKFQTMKSEFNTSGIVDTQSSKLGASVNIKDGDIHYAANGMTTLRVFNAQGQCAGTYSINESGVINANLGTGLYVVTMSNGSTTVPFKVLAK